MSIYCTQLVLILSVLYLYKCDILLFLFNSISYFVYILCFSYKYITTIDIKGIIRHESLIPSKIK